VRVAHFDCFSGISGDMVLGAVIDAGVDADAIRAGLDSLGLPIKLVVEPVKRGTFAAKHARVEAPDEHAHRHLHHIEAIINKGKLTDRQRDLALRVFRRLGEAEAAAHGKPIEKIHFHEVGALDSIADIAGAAIGLDLLGVERFSSSAVPTGTGMVKCAHGMMPIPAPGTAELLKGVPLRPSSIKSELTTPTGAAILRTIVEEWTDAPAMTIQHIGHGAGSRELLDQPNLLRLLVGQTAPQAAASDRLWVLETNLDDVPSEIVGYTFDLLFAAGAVDVFSTPIFMKKNRPGVLLSVLAPEAALPAVEDILFRETSTFGIRRYAVDRHKLHRKSVTVDTPWGAVAGKLGWLEGRAPIFTPEYEDCARIARAHHVPLREVFDKVRQCYTGE
jgi:uncharacterized protein (TIGR00299 family) protein